MLCLDAVAEMSPFLMTVVSDADLWMFVSSSGGLTCGRRSAERCLFPYETDDRLHRAGGMVGPITELRVSSGPRGVVHWSPWAITQTPNTTRRLYKSELGHQVIFEENHTELGLTFRYRWANARSRGFVRTSELFLDAACEEGLRIDVVDGLLDLMPAGVSLTTQQRASALVNAYRHAELDSVSGRLAIYRLTSQIVDKAEPAEALTCNAVWSVGLPGAAVLLSRAQLPSLKRGQAATTETEVAGRPASYLLASTLDLSPGQTESWDIVADVGLTQAEVVHRRQWPAMADIRDQLEVDVEADGLALMQRLVAADGLQRTGVPISDAHHLANVLFNCMRGGVFMRGYLAPAEDIRSFVMSRNRAAAERNPAFLHRLSEQTDCNELVKSAAECNDPDLLRLCLEYLPITFSRRHGDPSRPWNAFDIQVDGEQGAPRLYYQGNWRDIFQNWEALAVSFPGYLPQMIAKFVNASTADGFNPYRISSEGIDWEIPDEHDPWSNIGYWGDHQIVYLTRLLELSESFWPGALGDWLSEPVFAFADVPYRLRPYSDLVKNPRDSIQFDTDLQEAIEQRVKDIGADGRLLPNRAGQVLHVSLAEKLLVPVLSKLCNLVFDGGIWMNTQRPEWNDANNALAGYGLSMVTLYHLRRHLTLCLTLFENHGHAEVELTEEVARWFDRVQHILRDHCALQQHPEINDQRRRELLDALGAAFGDYRRDLYKDGLGGGPRRTLRALAELYRTALPFLDHAIRVNRRSDELYEAYNLLHVSPDSKSAEVSSLYEMLEGQVAVLSAGVLSGAEAVEVLDALFASPIYRPDQHSFMLYPDRRLPNFLEKNIIPPEHVAKNPLMQQLLEGSTPSVVLRDAEGHHRFAAHLSNPADLTKALDQLSKNPRWAQQVRLHRELTLETWESVFHHHAFTGRSGSMYGYEGLGCIYWHMVSKLLLAVQENLLWAQRDGAPTAVVDALKAHYRRIRGGLGSGKTPQEYGAFPSDPYSHTSKHGGAQQPGMTGQVKEEILARLGELGVSITQGRIGFGVGLLTAKDFLNAPTSVVWPNSKAGLRVLAGTLVFTVAQVPVVYHQDKEGTGVRVVVTDSGGQQHEQPGPQLSREWSEAVFLRNGRASKIDVWIPAPPA